MNIIFLNYGDPNDINQWSGTLYHIYHKLKERHNVVVVGTEIYRQMNVYYSANFKRGAFIPVDRYMGTINRLLSERLSHFVDFDVVFFGEIFFCALELNMPQVILSDMTFHQTLFVSQSPDSRNIEASLRFEKLLFDNASKIIYPTEWIKQKAMKFYPIDEKKISIVEFGANIPTPENYSIEINMDVCNFVFIGKQWETKGGKIVLQMYELLKKEGFPCTLTIIGSKPDKIDTNDRDLRVYPFLDKSDKVDLECICKILSESHFLVLPTVFDAFGIVFCEASAFAVPSIASDVGGVSQVVRDGKNGYLLPYDATAVEYAEKVKTLFYDRERYYQLRQSSRHEFETRLNWDIWGEKVNNILEEAVTEWKVKY